MSAEQPQPPLKDDVITAVQLTLAVLFVLGGLGIAHIIIRSYYEKGPVVYPLEGALVLLRERWSSTYSPIYTNEVREKTGLPSVC